MNNCRPLLPIWKREARSMPELSLSLLGSNIRLPMVTMLISGVLYVFFFVFFLFTSSLVHKYLLSIYYIKSAGQSLG